MSREVENHCCLASSLGVSKLFCKGPNTNCFSFVAQTVSDNHSALLLYHKSQRQYENERLWLGSNKTLFTKTRRPTDLTPWFSRLLGDRDLGCLHIHCLVSNPAHVFPSSVNLDGSFHLFLPVYLKKWGQRRYLTHRIVTRLKGTNVPIVLSIRPEMEYMLSTH